VLRALFYYLVGDGVYSEEEGGEGTVPLMYFISKQGSGSVWTGLTPLLPSLGDIFPSAREGNPKKTT